MKQSLKYWTPEDFEISSYKWSFKERPGKQFLGNGSDKGTTHYRFNEIGFRGDNTIFNGVKLMSVGCSHTEGIGVKDIHTWPHLLSRKIKTGIDYNLGMSGRSNDYISRAILTWTDYLKPHLVLIMYTYPDRREYYTETGGIEPFHKNPWGYFDEDISGRMKWANVMSISNDEENFINWYKNHQLITYYLKSKRIPFIWNGTFLKTDYTDENRFDGDYPYFEDVDLHANEKVNEAYAETLFNYITEKFEI